MRFQKLAIHNISSIAEAVIDFERLMPDDRHIFMIWGPSGSGKSTILDAICMALFCKTPRLQSIAEKKENQYIDPEFQFSDKAKGIAINDLRQYLKRGTREGWSELQFVGNDSVTYIARTAFAINRNGNLNNVEWSLRSENGVWTKVKEVEQQVVTVTGLTYEQFCRTTLLAQGEFTKFMKSSQDDKAEILEKLTDTSVFSEIGRRIFEKYNQKKKACEQLNTENEAIARLSEEQIAEYQETVRAMDAESRQMDETLSLLLQKSNWLKQQMTFQNEAAMSDKQWKEAETALNSDENVRLKQQLTQWERTENERNTFLDLRKKRSEMLETERKENEYKIDYQKLISGYKALQLTLDQTEASKRQLQAALDAQAYKTGNFSNAAVISEKLKQFSQFDDSIAQRKKNIAVNSQKLADNEGVLRQKEFEIAQLKANLEEKEKSWQALRDKSAAYDLNRLTLSQAAQKDRIRDLKEVQKTVQVLKNRQNEIKELKRLLAEKQQRMEELDVRMRQEEVAYAKAQEMQDSAQKCYDSAAQSVHDFAKQVRATLQIGDICPVCGQKVSQLLTDEAAEESLLHLEKTLSDAKNAVRSAKNALDTTITNLKTVEGERIGLQSDLQNKSLSQQTVLTELKETCLRLQILVNEAILDQISRQLADSEAVLTGLDEKIAVSQKLNAEIEQVGTEVDKLKRQSEVLLRKKHETELEVARLKKDTENLEALQRTEGQQKETLQSEISGFLAATYPEWMENPSKTAQLLSAEARNYAQMQEKCRILQETEENGRREQQQVERCIRQVQALFEWPTTERVQNTDHLVEKWTDFVPNCTVLFQNRAALRTSISEKEALLKNFYAEHIDIQEDTLTMLANFPQETIGRMRAHLTEAQQQVQTAYGKWQQAQATLQKHQEGKPVFAEGEDLAFIDAQITDEQQKKTEKLQKIGQIQQILAADADNKRKYAAVLSQLEALRQEVRQWERLNAVFGDSTGKVFRRIAQSFILQRLLDQTNYFLSMLSDRYELTGAGRELMILVKDKYLGDAPRPVEMVSGGESFLISIALALGLSNLAMQGFSSDFLFIDEGISQLDSNLCDTVTGTLQQLHHIVHCNIGIISHLDVLADKIPTKIVVRPVSHGTSEVRVMNG